MATPHAQDQQAIAFLIICLKNNWRGEINWVHVNEEIGNNPTDTTAMNYYHHILRNAVPFEGLGHNLEFPADTSWVSVVVEPEDDIILIDGHGECDG